MDRKRRIWSRILICITVFSCSYGCTDEFKDPDMAEIRFDFSTGAIDSKSNLPDEEKISDINLLIFDNHGMIERKIYLRESPALYQVNLLKGMSYSILACANLGYQLNVERIEDTENIYHYMAYPDEYKEGIPMAAIDNITIHEDQTINIEFQRMMAKITVKMDRSRLSEGVEMNVVSLKIGNCPKKVNIFNPSRITDNDDCFRVGFNHDDVGCTPLNRINYDRKSDELSVYMLENLQGEFGNEIIETDNEKVFEDHDPRQDICSYIELELEYEYEDLGTREKPLIYRFYLGENRTSLNIERNCHYHINICPHDDGLNGDGWRVDKSGIEFIGTPGLVEYPESYIIGDIGDKIHLGCLLTPSYAPFDIGISYLEADKAAGIYDYTIDDDGHGVTLTLKSPGTGLIYMEAGEPINDSALFIIEVNLPKRSSPDTSQYKTYYKKPTVQECRRRQDHHLHLQPLVQGLSPNQQP